MFRMIGWAIGAVVVGATAWAASVVLAEAQTMVEEGTGDDPGPRARALSPA